MAGNRLTPAEKLQRVIEDLTHDRSSIKAIIDRRVAALEEKNAPLVAKMSALDRAISDQRKQLEEMD